MSRDMLRAGGAGLSDEQREEMTNREGVAAGGATTEKENYNPKMLFKFVPARQIITKPAILSSAPEYLLNSHHNLRK